MKVLQVRDEDTGALLVGLPLTEKDYVKLGNWIKELIASNVLKKTEEIMTNFLLDQTIADFADSPECLEFKDCRDCPQFCRCDDYCNFGYLQGAI